MNKFCLICASVACLSFFSSCNKSEFEKHDLSIVYPNNYKVMYADQDEDSLIFSTFDSYVASPYKSDWITITAGASYDITYNPYNLYTLKVLLAFDQNTTGETRYGIVKVDSHGETVSGIYAQLGFLNINHPTPTYPTIDYSIPESATFELQVPANSEADSICFTVSHPWTLNFSEGVDQSWLTIDKTSGQTGHNNIAIRLTPNTDENNARNTSLVLKSGEVANVINIKQLSAKTAE